MSCNITNYRYNIQTILSSYRIHFTSLPTSEIYPLPKIVRIGIVNAFLTIGLLRLTNLNYYLSQLLGFETEINNTGGNAFNFTNYLGVGILFFVLLSKGQSLRTRWLNSWPIVALMLIYGISAVVAPYTNYSWVIYQELFLVIALVLHIYVQKLEASYLIRFSKGIRLIFWASMLLVVFSASVLYLKNDISYFIQEFNEVFVQTLDDFGIMKQRYGYLMGFLIAYAIFILRNKWMKVTVILLILSTSFGIRSFLIGLFGAALIFLPRGSGKKLLITTTVLLAIGIFYQSLFQQLIYDTRFYPYLNAWDIIGKYPFGVGLGGYPFYTEENSRLLFASFYDINAILDYIPLAPESDIVHLFGSLGLFLATIHCLIIARIIWFSFKLQSKVNAFQRSMLFYFVFMTFFGISEDSIFSINYWIVFGIASGIIARQQQKYKKLKYG